MTKSRRADADLESRGSKSDGAVSAHAMLDATDWRGPFSFRKSSSNSVRIHRIRTTFAARSDGSNSNDFCRAHRPLRERKDGSNSNDLCGTQRRFEFERFLPRASTLAGTKRRFEFERLSLKTRARIHRSFRSLTSPKSRLRRPPPERQCRILGEAQHRSLRCNAVHLEKIPIISITWPLNGSALELEPLFRDTRPRWLPTSPTPRASRTRFEVGRARGGASKSWEQRALGGAMLERERPLFKLKGRLLEVAIEHGFATVGLGDFDCGVAQFADFD